VNTYFCLGAKVFTLGQNLVFTVEKIRCSREGKLGVHSGRKYAINELSGKIKILAPTNFAIGPLANAWSTFISTYENIKLEFDLGFKTENFLATQADFAIRIGPQQSSDLSQARIGASKTILTASHEYIERYGFPTKPDDLDSHCFVVASSLQNWQLHNKQDNTLFHFHATNPRVVANDLRMIKQLTIDGLGISLLPAHEIVSELGNNQLVQVLPVWAGHDRDIYIIWENGRPLTRRAKLLIEHLKAHTANIPSLQGIVPVFDNPEEITES